MKNYPVAFTVLEMGNESIHTNDHLRIDDFATFEYQCFFNSGIDLIGSNTLRIIAKFQT